jgi:hypothetical protein
MVFFLYTDCYVATVDAHAGDITLLLPNLTFVLAVLLFAVFRCPSWDWPDRGGSE